MTVEVSKLFAAIAEIVEARRRVEAGEHRALVMYSGGLDSVAILHALLTSTDLTVHAHHIEIVNVESRHEAENAAITHQQEWFARHCRSFTTSTSRSEFMLGRGGGVDTSLTLFTAARVHTAHGGLYRSIWTGHIRPPEWEVLEGAAVLNAMFINKARRPLWFRPLRQLSKSDIYTSMPAELAAMTWSCRRPVATATGFTRCGQCHACKSRMQLDAGGKPVSLLPIPPD